MGNYSEEWGNPQDSDLIAARFKALSKNRSQLVASLGSVKRRRKEGLFVVEGHKNVTDLLAGGGIFEVVWLIATPAYILSHLDDISGCWHLDDSKVYYVAPARLRELSALSAPSDVMAVLRLPSSTGNLLSGSPLPMDLYLMLDGVQDPGNLGTIVRTCHWFGIRRIFASRDTVDIFNPKAIQSTMGSLGAVEVTYLDLPSLAAANPEIPVVGLQLEGDNIFHAPLPDSAFICMGSEGNGLSESMRRMLKHSYTIPPFDHANHPESLNVAIATAITLAQLRR